MRRLLPLTLVMLVFASSAFAAGDANRVKEYEPSARKGDYQAQRNLAFTLATSHEPQVRNPYVDAVGTS